MFARLVFFLVQCAKARTVSNMGKIKDTCVSVSRGSSELDGQ